MEKRAEKSKIQATDTTKKVIPQKAIPPISWTAPEFEYEPKDVSWYWLSLIISIILLGVAIWQKNFLFAIFIVIAWLIVINMARRLPSFWEFKIDEGGILIHLAQKPDESNKFYAWQDIEGFDIHGGINDYKELVIRLKSKLSPFIKINFQNEKENEIAAFCSKFIPRQEYEESAADHLARLIKF